MPAFCWGAPTYDLWWTVITAPVLGVGIGVLAQPQLMVRFMTVRSRREVDRAVPIGAVFILLMAGTPFVVGSLSNAWFAQNGPLLRGKVVEVIDAEKDRILVELMQKGESGTWTAILNPKTQAPVGASMIISERTSASGDESAPFELAAGRSIAATYTKGDADKIIPTFIMAAMPRWFGPIFFGLCAASFLPAYIGGLVSTRVTRAGALVSMSVGMSVSLFWLLFIKTREVSAIGLVQLVNGGKTSLLADYPNWPSVDPIIIALPAAVLTRRRSAFAPGPTVARTQFNSGAHGMLGIDDPYVLMAYLGAVSMAVIGIIYGLVRRNAARDEVTPEDRLWVLDEKKVDDDF
jgi:hypothetical protein